MFLFYVVEVRYSNAGLSFEMAFRLEWSEEKYAEQLQGPAFFRR